MSPELVRNYYISKDNDGNIHLHIVYCGMGEVYTNLQMRTHIVEGNIKFEDPINPSDGYMKVEDVETIRVLLSACKRGEKNRNKVVDFKDPVTNQKLPGAFVYGPVQVMVDWNLRLLFADSNQTLLVFDPDKQKITECFVANWKSKEYDPAPQEQVDTFNSEYSAATIVHPLLLQHPYLSENMKNRLLGKDVVKKAEITTPSVTAG